MAEAGKSDETPLPIQVDDERNAFEDFVETIM